MASNLLETWFKSLEVLDLPIFRVPLLREAKIAYKAVSLANHPDKCSECDISVMQQINSSYDFIKANYDASVTEYSTYLHKNTNNLFSFTDINVDEHSETLGSLFYDLGL